MRKRFTHRSAIIDDTTSWRDKKKTFIGKGTHIWHFSHVCSGAFIGEDCMLGQNVYIGSDVNIGNRVRIQNNVSVYNGVTMENDIFVGPSVVFTNVHLPMPTQKAEKFSATHVRSGAMIGANSTIITPCLIGKNAVIGAGSVVTSDVPDNAVVYGNPARVIRINDEQQ